MKHPICSRRRSGRRCRKGKRSLQHTYHDSHSRTRQRRGDPQHQANDLPALVPTLLAPANCDDVRDDACQLDYNCERHEEADGPPHTAEGALIAHAVFVDGERFAGSCY